jgi:acetyl-CoA C-acetyltransferase
LLLQKLKSIHYPIAFLLKKRQTNERLHKRNGLKYMVYIVDAKRTPIGSFQGQLASYQGWQLGAEILKSLKSEHLPEEVIMGSVLTAGQGQAPCRQAVINAFETDKIPSSTVNKVCGSGMFSVMLSCQQIQLGHRSLMMAGGFESMTNAPYFLAKARSGYRFGHDRIYDHMAFDGLEDAYSSMPDGTRKAMGLISEKTAEKYGLSREDQDLFARQTYENYHMAESKGALNAERIALSFTDKKGNVITLDKDEPPLSVKPDRFATLRPAFSKDGTITAATSSSIADGAAALVLTSESGLNGRTPLAKIVGYSSHSHAPEFFTTAPIHAIQTLLEQVKWSISDVDLFEINEAFAVVPMAAMKELKIPREKLNIHGGACTLGHPIGASGARIIVTLVHALKHHGLKRGIAAACIGGGEATAIAIEIV